MAAASTAARPLRARTAGESVGDVGGDARTRPRRDLRRVGLTGRSQECSEQQAGQAGELGVDLVAVDDLVDDRAERDEGARAMVTVATNGL